MIKLIDILTEGVYDPGIFKAVFTAGGPGSGKSYVASTLFGMPEKMPFVSAKGLKSVNSDKYFETYLKMSGAVNSGVPASSGASNVSSKTPSDSLPTIPSSDFANNAIALSESIFNVVV